MKANQRFSDEIMRRRFLILRYRRIVSTNIRNLNRGEMVAQDWCIEELGAEPRFWDSGSRQLRIFLHDEY